LKQHLLISVGVTALAAAWSAPVLAQERAPEALASPPPAGPALAPSPRPAGKGLQMTLPLLRQGRVYGDVLATVYLDGTIEFDRQSLIERLAPLLSSAGQAQLAATLPATPSVSIADVEKAGLTLVYDSAELQVRVERIDGAMVAVQSLGDEVRFSQPPTTLEPEKFSAYVNAIGDFRLRDFEDFETPALILQAAVRYGGVVVEFDGGYDQALTDGKGFYRRQARAVYDQYEKQRRWSAGDLQLNNGLSITSGTLMGGVGLEKGRRVFTGGAPLVQLGGQQVLLDRDATLDVIVDGQQVERFQVNAGTYDLSQLQSQYGGRNAQLFITDVSGRRQVTSFDSYYNVADLIGGEDEYGAAIGFVPTNFRSQPIYGGKPAFSGYYRRGITNRFLIGGALQASEEVQVAAVEIVTQPTAIPGRFELSGAASTGKGSGFSLRGAYSLQLGYGIEGKQFSISADYRSKNFSTLSDAVGFGRFETLTLTANYSQQLSERTSVIVGGNWFEREGLRSTKLAFLDVVHRTPRFRITGGVEYGKDVFGRKFGGRVTLTLPFGPRTRVEAGYNSRRDDARLTLTRSYDESVGSFGFDVSARRSDGTASLDGQATYNGNRFYSRFTTISSGDGFSNIGDRQDTRLQVGTSIAIAGGSVAIGRPIQDSFLVAKPHPALDEKQVVVGQSVDAGKVEAESGAFGPALYGRVNSYNRQSVEYDLKDGTEGYDIGTGVHTINPPYKSGYKLVVGSDASVSAYGFLYFEGGKAELLSGMVSGIDDPDFQPQPFFTNSVGRFAVQGLRPGKSYRIELRNGAQFRIAVPADNKSLLQLGDVIAQPAAGAQE
jgi:outer membrane usher protein